MAKAANNNKSIILEGVEVFYQEKTDSFNIISTDPELPKGQFFMKVKEGTLTDSLLRVLFAEKTGNKKSLKPNSAIDLPQETLTLTDFELKKNFDRDVFPLGVSHNKETVTWQLGKGNSPTNILISGEPGCGKTMLTEQIIRKAEISKIPVLKWSGTPFKKDFLEREQFKIDLESLFSQPHAEPSIVIIDRLEAYLTSPLEDVQLWDETLKDWEKSVEELIHLLRLARSKNVTFVLVMQRPELKIQKKLESCIGLNLVGSLPASNSAIALRSYDAVNLRNAQFVVKTAEETKVMKAFHPAMKSDWV